jgi:transcriptional regulator with XRE-family HTH domain
MTTPPDAWSNEAIAKRLTALRELRDLNQREFADFLEIGWTAYNNYETGVSRISLDAARRVLLKTGASLDWIYYGNPAAMPQSLLNQLHALDRKAG